VSPDFFASDFIHKQELGPLLKKAEQGGIKILWIPVRSSAYKQTPLKNYQALIDPSKPLASMLKAKRDGALDGPFGPAPSHIRFQSMARSGRSTRRRGGARRKAYYRVGRPSASEAPSKLDTTKTNIATEVAFCIISIASSVKNRSSAGCRPARQYRKPSCSVVRLAGRRSSDTMD
jgi:hypothetical protein